MMFIDSLKQKTLLALLLMSQGIVAEQPIGALVAGQNDGTAPFSQYTSIVSTFNGVVPVSLPASNIATIALNSAGVGLVGGEQNPNYLYGAFITSASGVQTILFPTTPNSFLNSSAINSTNLGLVGGVTNNTGYAAFVSPSSLTPTPLINLPANSYIISVALSDSGSGLIGGTQNSGNIYLGAVTSNSTTATNVPVGVGSGAIEGVAINNFNVGLVGGYTGNFINFPYAAFIMNNQATSNLLSGSTGGVINSVAINDASTGLIGGHSGFGSGAAYAAFVFPGAAPQVITGLPADSTIFSVDLNDSGQGLIGGLQGDNMYAAFVSVGAAPTELLGLPAGEVLSVAINDFNQGLIGGTNFILDTPYAAIVSSSGVVTPLNLGFTNGEITSVAINTFLLSQIPSDAGLTGNNLIFANYINENAPQDAFYFVPSAVYGSLPSALESAAPTRNMISYNTVMQNSFYLTTNLSAHLRNQRFSNRRAPRPRNAMAFVDLDTSGESELLAANSMQPSKTNNTSCSKKAVCQSVPACPAKTASLWFEAIGALAYQDAQQQTTAFNPQTLGGTFGFDGKVASTFTIGGGGSYLYTHVHEKNHQGHSNIQQEDLFAYASWQPRNFYVDLGIWGGLYQTKQTRHIQLSGFDFKATSKPRGWQVVPHLELGFLATVYCSPKLEITGNLLGMADWANAWQYRYTEKGDSPFNVRQDSHYGSLLRAEGGLRLSETLFFQKGNIIFQEKGSYVNIHSFKAGRMDAFIVGSPGAFTLQTLTNAQNLGLVQLSMTAAPHHSGLPSSMLMYQGEFGSGYQSHQLNVEFAWNF